jgi:hypothetical protein
MGVMSLVSKTLRRSSNRTFTRAGDTSHFEQSITSVMLLRVEEMLAVQDANLQSLLESAYTRETLYQALIDLDPSEEECRAVIWRELPGADIVARYLVDGDPSFRSLQSIVETGCLYYGDDDFADVVSSLTRKLGRLSTDELLWCVGRQSFPTAFRSQALEMLLSRELTDTQVYLLVLDGEFGHKLGRKILGTTRLSNLTLRTFVERFSSYGSFVVPIAQRLLTRRPTDSDLLAVIKGCQRYRVIALDLLLRSREVEPYYLYWSLGYSASHDEEILSRLLERYEGHPSRRVELARFCLNRGIDTQSELMAEILLADPSFGDSFYDSCVLKTIISLRNRLSEEAANRLLKDKPVGSWRRRDALKEIHQYLPAFLDPQG